MSTPRNAIIKRSLSLSKNRVANERFKGVVFQVVCIIADIARSTQIGSLICKTVFVIFCLLILLPWLATLILIRKIFNSLLNIILRRHNETQWPSKLCDIFGYESCVYSSIMLLEESGNLQEIKKQVKDFLTKNEVDNVATKKDGNCLEPSLNYTNTINQYILESSGKWRNHLITNELLPLYVSSITSTPLLRNQKCQIIIIPVFDTSKDVWNRHYAIYFRYHCTFKAHFKKDFDTIKLDDLRKSIFANKIHESRKKKLELEAYCNDLAETPQRTKYFYNYYYSVQNAINIVTRTGSILYDEISSSYFQPKTNKVKWFAKKKQTFTGNKYPLQSISWSESIPNELIKAIAAETNTSCNKVILGCIGGALKQYLQIMVGRVPDDIQTIIAKETNDTIPQCAKTLLPVGSVIDTITRISLIKKRFLKHVDPAFFTQTWKLITKFIQYAFPRFWAKHIFGFFTRNYSVLIYYKEISEISGNNQVSFQPPVSKIGLTITVHTFYQHTKIAVLSRKNILQSSSFLTNCFNREVHNLAYSLGMRSERRSPPPTPIENYI